ncbi:MAG: hypothetical protein Roseis2KO_39550 [Roseivirga sp.]
MKKLYPRVDAVYKKNLIILLIVFFIPNLSKSQTNITLIPDLNSFETPQVTAGVGYQYRPGGSEWTFIGDAGLTKNGTAFTWDNPNAPLGNQVLFLQNQGYVETSFNFTVSGYYRFRFKAAWREGCCSTVKDKIIRVVVNDGTHTVEVAEFKLKSENYDEYITLPVFMPQGAHLVQLHGDNISIPGDYTGFVDDFRIERLPVMPNYSGWTVPAGATYAIGSNAYNFSSLNIDGTLVAAQNQNVNISANYVLVRNSGRLQIGQELAPYTREATITLKGTNPSQMDVMHMGTKFLGAMNNGVIELHGKEKVSWTKLRETVSSVSSTPNRLKLTEAVDWEVGDEIVIAPSRAPGRDSNGDEDDSFAYEYEKRKINSLTNSNKDLILDAGVDYQHTGQKLFYSGYGQSWAPDIRAEVGLLSRNIKIQGDGMGTKFGAHVMIMRTMDDMMYNRKPKAYFNGVELYRVGQVKKTGRYPFHWHQMDDVDGQYFKNSSVHQSYNRALTIHRTNNTLVENNVFFDHIGHGIFFEEGNEEGNKILGNLVIGSKRPSAAEAISSHVEDGETINEWQNRGPAAYWITHPNNTIEGNVAAGTVGTGFWYIFPRWDTGGQNKEPQKAPFGSFKNNVAHSANSGFDIFDELGWTDWNNNVSQFYPHSVRPNVAYLSTSFFEILNCTWYANRVGVYTGTAANTHKSNEYGREIYAPNDHLVFKNNIFADNEKAVMLASNNQIKNSIFIEDTGLGNAPQSDRSLVFMYDGAATVSNSHIVGYRSSSASSIMSLAGASVTYGNFKFKDITKDGNVHFYVPTGQVDNELRRNATVYDQDGSLTGSPGTIVVNNEFNLFGNNDPYEDDMLVGWFNAQKSTRRYVNTRLFLHLEDAIANVPPNTGDGYGWFPDVNVIRTKSGTITRNKAYNYREPILPFMVNDKNLLYTYDLANVQNLIPNLSKRIIGFQLTKSAEPGDFVIVRFTQLGSLRGLFVDMNSDERINLNYPDKSALEVSREFSLTSLKNSGSSAYYINPNTKELYIKAFANGDFYQYFNIKWGLQPGGVANNTERLGEEQSLTEITGMIYPNPASTELYIKGLTEGEEVQIVDLGGRVILTTTYKEHLDISQLKSGVYVVRTKSGNHRFIKD